MPLFMDFHIIPDINMEEVKNAHIADEAVQDKYNVKFHQFWVNEEAGTVFCLMEAPDKESCIQTHLEAHGGVACNVVEVEPGMYNLFMGEKHQIDHGLVRHRDGSVDVGYRYVLITDITGHTVAENAKQQDRLVIPFSARNLLLEIASDYDGKQITLGAIDSIATVFISAEDALNAAVEIHSEFISNKENTRDPAWNIYFKMGLCGGEPLTREEGFFETTLKLGRRLSLIAGEGELLVSNLIPKTGSLVDTIDRCSFIKVLKPSEEELLEAFFRHTDQKLTDSQFSIEYLCRAIGISRPQLYRKITSLSGISPNVLIRNLRMQKALSLLREDHYNIAEITYLVGYSNPSYFAKCFQEQYGISPSKLIV